VFSFFVSLLYILFNLILAEYPLNILGRLK